LVHGVEGGLVNGWKLSRYTDSRKEKGVLQSTYLISLAMKIVTMNIGYNEGVDIYKDSVEMIHPP